MKPCLKAKNPLRNYSVGRSALRSDEPVRWLMPSTCPRVTPEALRGLVTSSRSTHAERPTQRSCGQQPTCQAPPTSPAHLMSRTAQDALRAVNVHTFHIEQPIP